MRPTSSVRVNWASSLNSRTCSFKRIDKAIEPAKREKRKVSRSDRFGGTCDETFEISSRMQNPCTRRSTEARESHTETRLQNPLWTARDDPTDPIQSDRYNRALPRSTWKHHSTHVNAANSIKQRIHRSLNRKRHETIRTVTKRSWIIAISLDEA